MISELLKNVIEIIFITIYEEKNQQLPGHLKGINKGISNTITLVLKTVVCFGSKLVKLMFIGFPITNIFSCIPDKFFREFSPVLVFPSYTGGCKTTSCMTSGRRR